jgi:small subunit ribosomal protein S16
MALKIRLRQQGRKNHLVYRLVLTDTRSPRDGKYLEMLGWYNPNEKDEQKVCNVEESRVRHWLAMGAEITTKAKVLISKEAPEVIKEYQGNKTAALAKVCEKKRLLRKRQREIAVAKK